MPTTGPRNINTLLEPGVDAGDVWLVRSGPIVTLSISNVTFQTDSGFAVMLRLPTGFRPPFVLRGNLIGSDEEPNIAVYSDGRVSSQRRIGYVLREVFTYHTADPWPSSLPGEAA